MRAISTASHHEQEQARGRSHWEIVPLHLWLSKREGDIVGLMMQRGAARFSAMLVIVGCSGCGNSDDSGGGAVGGASGAGGTSGAAGNSGGGGGASAGGGTGGSGGTTDGGSSGGGTGGTPIAKRVFVTSTELEPDFGSAAAADATCQGIADGVTLGGTWMAWLSDDNSTPVQRFTQASIPYTLLDGTEIATSFDDLVDGSLATALNRDENDAAVGTDVFAWTGTQPDGTASTDNCMNWTVAIASTGTRGATTATDGTWTADGVAGCFFPQHLYCFEQ